MCDEEDRATRSDKKTSDIENIRILISKYCTEFYHQTFRIHRLHHTNALRHDNNNNEQIHEIRKIYIMQNDDDSRTISVSSASNNVL